LTYIGSAIVVELPAFHRTGGHGYRMQRNFPEERNMSRERGVVLLVILERSFDLSKQGARIRQDLEANIFA